MSGAVKFLFIYFRTKFELNKFVVKKDIYHIRYILSKNRDKYTLPHASNHVSLVNRLDGHQSIKAINIKNYNELINRTRD